MQVVVIGLDYPHDVIFKLNYHASCNNKAELS